MSGLFDEIPSGDFTLDEITIQQLVCVIQCDGYVVYPSWAKNKPWVKLMVCHSHVRRKFFEAREQSPRIVGWILRQIAHLYRIETVLRETKAGPRPARSRERGAKWHDPPAPAQSHR